MMLTAGRRSSVDRRLTVIFVITPLRWISSPSSNRHSTLPRRVFRIPMTDDLALPRELRPAASTAPMLQPRLDERLPAIAACRAEPAVDDSPGGEVSGRGGRGDNVTAGS